MASESETRKFLTCIILEFLLNFNRTSHFGCGDFKAQPICLLFTLVPHQSFHARKINVAKAKARSRGGRLVIALEGVQTSPVTGWLVM